MALGALVATQLTDRAVRPYALWIDGMDVLLQPGARGNGYGTAADSIVVEEAGPGRVSAMTFVIGDPLGAVPVPASGAVVLFMDLTDDHPEFRGWVQDVKVRPHENPSGRYVDVTCVGVEALLDWTLVPARFYQDRAADAFASEGWQAAAASSTLRTAWQQPAPGQGTQAAPIGANVGSGATPGNAGLTTTSLATLRETIAAIFAVTNSAASPLTPQGIAVTVDYTLGLRAWYLDTFGSIALSAPDDYATLTIVDTVAGALQAEGLEYRLNYLEAPRLAYVTGAGGTVYGPYGDGTGKDGPQVNVNDPNVQTAAQAQAVAATYIGSRLAAIRGSFRLTAYNHGSTAIHAGSRVVITDAAAGLSAAGFSIYGITKTYGDSGLEDWTVAFGGAVPSGAALLRRLTRNTLS